MSTIRLQATDGTFFEFDDSAPAGSGGMKEVFFSKDRRHVVGWYRKKPDANAMERLKTITGVYRDRVFNQEGGAYWESLFCWPSHVIEAQGFVGVVMPAYQPHFFFAHGSTNDDFLGIRGKEKEGKWFASARHQQRHLDPRERGSWLSYFTVCIKIARAVKRLHMAGLAHSDLSYKNVLLDPAGGNACLIDLDTLVVPGKFPPDVAGTPDFIAPEVLRTVKLPNGAPGKSLPCIETDRHALAVLVYMYLLYRHPLRGRKIHDDDPQRDEELGMGERALFVEHPTDPSNRPDPAPAGPGVPAFGDVERIPFTVCGPLLKEVFERAFVTGLHDPAQRPSADDMERALVRTVDLMQPCAHPGCDQKWFVFDNTAPPRCPFCGTAGAAPVPMLDFHSRRAGDGPFLPDQHRLMIYHNQYLYPWHVSRLVFPNERLTPEQRRPVGYFVFHAGRWMLVNQTLTGLKDITSAEARPVPPGSSIVLENGQKLLLSPEAGGRMAQVTMAGSPPAP